MEEEKLAEKEEVYPDMAAAGLGRGRQQLDGCR